MNTKQANALEQNLKNETKPVGYTIFDTLIDAIKMNRANLGLNGKEEYLALATLKKEENG